MWRKFDIPKGKWESWFGNILFSCRIWRTLLLKRLGGIQTQLLYGTRLYIITSKTFPYMDTCYHGTWNFQPLVQFLGKMIKMSQEGIASFELLLTVFEKYTPLCSFYSCLTFIVCVNIKQVPWKQAYLMIPKCWERQGQGGQESRNRLKDIRAA